MLLTAYLADKKLAPLLMSFTTWDMTRSPADPLKTGWRFELMRPEQAALVAE